MFDELREATNPYLSSPCYVDREQLTQLLAAFDALVEALKEIARTEKLSDDMTLVVYGHSAQKIAREALAAILGTNAVRSDGNGGTR